MANGKSTTATIVGKMNIATAQAKKFTFSDVLLIDGMPITLLSIPALMHANPDISLQFNKDSCGIFLGNDKLETAQMSADRRLYTFKGTYIGEYANNVQTHAHDVTALWHHRISIDTIKSLMIISFYEPFEFVISMSIRKYLVGKLVKTVVIGYYSLINESEAKYLSKVMQTRLHLKNASIAKSAHFQMCRICLALLKSCE
jgi:hypothetical protein